MKNTAIIALALIISACGGGSEDSATSSSSGVVSVPLQKAFSNLESNGLNGKFVISGWVMPYTNQPQISATGSGSLTIGPEQSTGLSPEIISGVVNGSPFNGTSNIDFGSFNIPATVVAGNAGTLANSTYYSVSADSQNSLLVQIANSTSNTLLESANQAQMVYRIDTAGNISLVSISTQEESQGIEFSHLTYTF